VKDGSSGGPYGVPKIVSPVKDGTPVEGLPSGGASEKGHLWEKGLK
jgi:hypothetical protein